MHTHFQFHYSTARGAVKIAQAATLTIHGPANLRFFGFSLLARSCSCGRLRVPDIVSRHCESRLNFSPAGGETCFFGALTEGDQSQIPVGDGAPDVPQLTAGCCQLPSDPHLLSILYSILSILLAVGASWRIIEVFMFYLTDNILRSSLLDEIPGISHGFSTRKGASFLSVCVP